MRGECLCSAVAFEFDPPVTEIEICHCHRCQHATGSAFAAGFYVRTETFRWLQGEELITKYEAPVLREPPPYRRWFCRRCGSPVPVLDAAAPSVEIPAGLIDKDSGARPTYQMWNRHRAAWTPQIELPAFDESPPAHERARLFSALDESTRKA